jgi:hypothetical protein
MRIKKAPLSLFDNGAFTTEKEGFEPTVRRRTTVFKTATISHSVTSPGYSNLPFQAKNTFLKSIC